MKRFLTAILCIATAMLYVAGMSANAADVTLDADAQDLTVDDLNWMIQDTGTIQIDFKNDGTAVSSYTGKTNWIWYGTNGLASDAIETVQVVGTNVISIASTSLTVAAPFFPGYFTFAVGIDNKTYGVGKFYPKPNPRIAASGTFSGTGTIDWSIFDFQNTASSGPYRAGTGITFSSANSDGSVDINAGWAAADTSLSNALQTAYIAADTALSNALQAAYIAADAVVDAVIDNHIADTTDAHDASAISMVATGEVNQTDVQSGVDWLALRDLYHQNAWSPGRLWGGTISTVGTNQVRIAAGGGLVRSETGTGLASIPADLTDGQASPLDYVSWNATTQTLEIGYNLVYYDASASGFGKRLRRTSRR